jgi:Leucine-rich repeat (LRR) protein
MDCLFSPGKEHEKFPDGWLKIYPPGELIRDASHLSLDNNRLRSLPEQLNAPTLEVLLAGNQISGGSFKLIIPPGFLENFSSLKVLDLENTCIDSLPETLGKLTNLMILELSGTMLTRFPRGLCNLTKLEYLGLSGCEDMEPFAIECLKNLSTLNTSGCKTLWQASTAEFELGPLQKLCSLTRLRNLSIEDPSCEHLPPQMSQLINLRYLTMSFERLKRLPPELHSRDGPQLRKLQHLSLRGCCNLSELPSWIGSLSHLTNLDLSRCGELTYIPNLPELPNLRILTLEGCKSLRQLPAPFGSKKPFLALEV